MFSFPRKAAKTPFKIYDNDKFVYLHFYSGGDAEESFLDNKTVAPVTFGEISCNERFSTDVTDERLVVFQLPSRRTLLTLEETFLFLRERFLEKAANLQFITNIGMKVSFMKLSEFNSNGSSESNER